MSSFYTSYKNLPNYGQKNITRRNREQRLKTAQEKGIPLNYANANLRSLAAVRAVSRKPLFNQLAEQGTALPPNVEGEILGYLGTKPGQTPNSIIRNITAKKKKEAHNAMVLERLLEAQAQMELESNRQRLLREAQKAKSRSLRGKNINLRELRGKTGKKQTGMYPKRNNTKRNNRK